MSVGELCAALRGGAHPRRSAQRAWPTALLFVIGAAGWVAGARHRSSARRPARILGVRRAARPGDAYDVRDRIGLGERERLHDARSAITGLLGAAALLARTDARSERDDLHRLMAAELTRLTGLLDPEHDEPLRPFLLGQELSAVIATHRLLGTRIDADLHDVRAPGRPGVTATVLDNLLTNAEVHASGTDVTIRALRGSGRSVVVTVDDAGPGIAPNERRLVLRAGGRGSAGDGLGRGLGLHSARVAMARQGGALRVDRSPEGGTRVRLTLRAEPADPVTIVARAG